ncbi:hypothetical protein TNCV_4410151 [Trichonephila clavipes]|nr:hypothetical protein TNCV_4410151 [Trichonephila clavipes]
MHSACDQSTLPIDVQVFHRKAQDPQVEAWRVGCHLSCPPRHSTEVLKLTVYEHRVRYKSVSSFESDEDFVHSMSSSEDDTSDEDNFSSVRQWCKIDSSSPAPSRFSFTGDVVTI